MKRNVVTRQQLSVYLSAFDGALLCKHGVFYTDVVGITRLILRRPPLCQNDQNRQVNKFLLGIDLLSALINGYLYGIV